MSSRKDSLSRYRSKRDFTLTPEPEGVIAKQQGRRYLIQKHAATRLHYDFRLELDGVLKSWAVARGPSLDPAEKRLAVEVEDHPVSYGSFEGIIPKGQYGGGTVMLWDEGEWEPIGDPREGLKTGKLEFVLKGKRLKGEWTLVRMRPRDKDKERGRNNWLLIKHRDKEARDGDGEGLTERYTTSVESKRDMAQIASDKDAVWQSNRAEAAKKPSSGKKARPLPGFIRPQLCTLVDALPEGKEWLHEIKFDGFRMLAYVEGGKARMFTRNGLDWTEKFAMLAAALARLPAQNAILDGEAVVLDGRGVSNFSLLKDVLGGESDSPFFYFAFDLLYLNGEDLRPLPLLERKARLESLLGDAGLSDRGLMYSQHLAGTPRQLMDKACRMGLEGLISKRADAGYRSKRDATWLKTKCSKRQEFVIGGFTEPTHQARGLGALLLGYYEGTHLRFAGKVGTGFTHDFSAALRKKLDKLARPGMPFDAVPTDGRRGAHWVQPKLVCEVEFTDWTGDGRLRHPSFQGLREDKKPQSIRRERAEDVQEAEAESKQDVKENDTAMPAKKPAGTARAKGRAMVGGIGISSPDRLIYAGTAITKERLAQYYDQVADRLLPHVANRPLSLLRCPEGSSEPCFFQRHLAHGQPHLHEVEVGIKGRRETYLMIKDRKGLLTLIQWGVIELHPWGCLADRPELPDRIIFDLDPDPAVPWKHMVEGAREIKQRMEEFGLQSFLKTTGGKGLHVTVPIARRYGFATVKAFARAVAVSMAHDAPQRYIATASKAKREGRIFVDYLRNDLTATAVAPFSARARDGATVATPLAWEELTQALKPARFTIETVPQRLAAQTRDPWRDFFETKQGVAVKILRMLGIALE